MSDFMLREASREIADLKNQVVYLRNENEKLKKHFLGLTREEQEQVNETDLKEIAHYYGGWENLKAVIKRLEEGDNEAAAERYFNRY